MNINRVKFNKKAKKREIYDKSIFPLTFRQKIKAHNHNVIIVFLIKNINFEAVFCKNTIC